LTFYLNIQFLNKESSDFINEWKDELPKLIFNFNEKKLDDLFNSYFGFLDSRQAKESYYVKKVFLNNTSLLNKYYFYQKKYRNNELLEDENNLKHSKEKLDLTIILSTQSLKYYLIRKEKDILNTEIKDFKKQKNDQKTNIKNMLFSYLLELKNTYINYTEKANKTSNYIEYNNLKKQSLIYKKVYRVLRKNIYKLTFLSLNDVEELIKSLFISNHDFQITTFLNISSDNKNFFDSILEKKKIILDDKAKILKIKTKSHKSNIDILSAKEEYQDSFDELNWNLKIYLKEFENENTLISKNIEDEKNINFQFKSELKKQNYEFDETHKKFIIEFKNFAKNNLWTKERIDQKTTFFINKVSEKKESLKSFEMEVINLNKDFQKILHLVGVAKNKLSKQIVKKILLKEKIYASLEEVGLLKQFAWRYPHEFSGGQRQRIVIARALISNPKLIIADEPIASLDISIQAQVVNLLKNLCKVKNVALIFIAHDLSMVEYIADTINIMHLGKIVESGETSQIYSNPVHPYTINLFNSIPRISNANIPFVASTFEINYLAEQKLSLEPVELFKCGKNHFVYANKTQYAKWMGVKESVKPNDIFSFDKKENSLWKDDQIIIETTIIDV